MVREKVRGKLKKQSVPFLPTEVWTIIASKLCVSPMSAFLLSMTKKSMHSAIDNDAWWQSFYLKVLDYQRSLKVSKFLKQMQTLSHMNPKTVLLMIFNRRCHFCGTKFNQSLVVALEVRTCLLCFRKNMVSNGVLEFKYGLSYADFIEDYMDQKCAVVTRNQLNTATASHSSTTDAIEDDQDLAKECKQYAANDSSNFLYFWRPHLVRVMNFNLREMEISQRKRRTAAQYLSARLLRLFNQKINYATSVLFTSKRWMPGCTSYAFFLEAPRAESCWRKGFNKDRHETINRHILSIIQDPNKKRYFLLE